MFRFFSKANNPEEKLEKVIEFLEKGKIEKAGELLGKIVENTQISYPVI